MALVIVHPFCCTDWESVESLSGSIYAQGMYNLVSSISSNDVDDFVLYESVDYVEKTKELFDSWHVKIKPLVIYTFPRMSNLLNAEQIKLEKEWLLKSSRDTKNYVRCAGSYIGAWGKNGPLVGCLGATIRRLVLNGANCSLELSASLEGGVGFGSIDDVIKEISCKKRLSHACHK